MRAIGSIIFFLVLSLQVFAQNLNKKDVKIVFLRNSGPIMHEETVNGYYFFYSVEKADRKNTIFELKLTDENLKEKKSLEIVKPTNTYLVDAQYNGEAFLFMFYDYKSKSTTFETYDNHLKSLGKVTNKVTGKLSIFMYSSLASGQPQAHSFLSSAGSNGFVYYGFEESKRYKYAIALYDNKLNLKWSAFSDNQSKDVEFAEAGFQSSKYIGTLISRRKSYNAKDVQYELLVNDKSNGKQILYKDLMGIDEQYNLTVTSVSYDEEKEHMYLFGEYFNAGDKQGNAFALGYFYFTLDMSGKVLKKRFVSWADDISKLMPLDKRGKMEKGTSLYVHEIVRMDNGDVYVIGEQFKKAASGAGIAMAALSRGRSGTATVQIEVLDMVVFKFDKELNLKKADIFSKGVSTILLPSGSEWLTTKMLSAYVKYVDGFDFAFSQIAPSGGGLSICYVDYEKAKGEKGRDVINSVSYSSAKDYTHSKIDISRKSTDYKVYKGKENHVMVAEYFKKEKLLDLRIEKTK